MDANQGSRKAYLLVFVLFILGIALGSVGTYLVTMRVQAARPAGSAHNPLQPHGYVYARPEPQSGSANARFKPS